MIGPTLTGTRAIITGASRGIGRAIAIAFAEHGADVALCHLDDAARAAETAAEIAALGRRVWHRAVDVTCSAELRTWVTDAIASLGGVDILVNNAGSNRRGTFETLSDDDFDAVIAVHLKANFVATQAVYATMLAQGHGRIINISSQLALKGSAMIVPYCAAKAGIIGLTRALALEAAPHGIRVNAIAPGPVATDLLAQRGPEFLAEITARLPAGRIAEPDEIAQTAVLLAGPGGDYYVGACLSPNGGDVAH